LATISDPVAFETITRNCSPLSAVVVTGVVELAEVAAVILVPFFCH
jgi:hypothetical protein